MTIRYDIVVVGAGIHGAGVAQAAAALGYKTLVLEKSQIAAGTSSKSSKLIHGGLRYLETMQFALVRECLRERSILLKIAPELVKLVPFHIPIYSHSQRPVWKIRAGLILYSLLGGNDKAARFEELGGVHWDKLDGLEQRQLRAVFRYYDAQTDDAALTRAVMRSAQDLGAQLVEQAEVVGVHIEADHCDVHYRHNDKSHNCGCTALVNAAGPWINELLSRVDPLQQTLAVDLVQGTHILVEGALQSGIYYLEAPHDRRAVFAIPWKGKILVGTTETRFTGPPEQVAPLREEQRYLLETVNYYFPRLNKGLSDIDASFAGLRVLPASATQSAFRRKRDTLLLLDQVQSPRIVSIYGGKLTAYRATAEKVIKRLGPVLPEPKPCADTRILYLNPDTK